MSPEQTFKAGDRIRHVPTGRVGVVVAVDHPVEPGRRSHAISLDGTSLFYREAVEPTELELECTGIEVGQRVYDPFFGERGTVFSLRPDGRLDVKLSDGTIWIRFVKNVYPTAVSR